MRRVIRLAAPHQLLQYAERWKQELSDALANCQLHGAEPPPEKLWNKYNKNYVRNRLKEMFINKCGYCESHIGPVSAGRIDHYRPKKGGYPKLTFSWENFIWSCERCNGIKDNNFPLLLDDPAQPSLVNPCDDVPADHLAFVGSRLVGRNERGEAAIHLLKLNRDDLFDHRRTVLRDFWFFLQSVVEHEQGGRLELAATGRAIIEEMLSERGEYTMMIQTVWLQTLGDSAEN